MTMLPAVPHARPVAPVAQRAPGDPLAWFLVEQRGPQDDGRYELTTLQLFNDGSGGATLDDGRMTFPRDSGVVEQRFQSVDGWARDGVDPAAAVDGARRGIELLAGAIDAAGSDLERFRVGQHDRLPRDPDTWELWLRRDSGEVGRFIVPRDDTPASVRDVQRAAEALQSAMRRDFDAQDAEQPVELRPTARA